MRTDVALLSASVLLVCSQSVTALEATPYGSLRLGAEYVDPDNNPGNFDSYAGLRDAYSRVGVKVSHALNDDWTLLGQIEVPIDLANMEAQSPYNDDDNMRIAKLQVSGPLGTLWYGRGWMPFYNAIAYPVDYFSSYYSGWATFTTFRREDTFYYSTPSWNGFSAAFATTDDNGATEDNRNQYTLSWSGDGLGLAIGLDDTNNASGLQILGASASYTTGPWYLAAKYEELSYDTPSVYDGDTVANLLVQYSLDEKNTLRGMVAEVGWDYGDTVFHVGWDHKYSDDLKVFVEYYREETTAAISDRRKSTFLGTPDFNAPADSGGGAFTVGLRYDF